MRDIARVDYGREIRRGVVTHNGTEEVVAGIVIKLFGENTSNVIARLGDAFSEVRRSLPEGVAVETYYNQKRLVDNATGTVTTALLQGGVLVLIALVLFLGNVRTAAIVAISLPVCALFAAIFMRLSGLSANLMSLGGIAIAIGMLGDGSIVVVENIHRCLTDAKGRNRSKTELIVAADMRRRIDERVVLPAGYWLEIGGQFENQQRAMRRLGIIVPTAFLMIFLMLYFSLGTFRQAALIFINVPLALIGGVLGLLITGQYLSVPASVGFIALFGIAVQNGLVLVTHVNQLRDEGVPIREAVVNGSLLRLRPVLMTAMTTVLGLIPLLLARGMGSEVQRPLAAVVVFGLVSSTILTLFLLPAMYEWFTPPEPVDESVETSSERKGQ